MSFQEKVKSFGMTNMLIESELDGIEEKYNLSLRDRDSNTKEASEIEEAYFPQFSENLRKEASEMSKNYEIFYCLEKTIRSQISERLEEAEGEDWWNEQVIPQHIVGDVKKRIKKERESGITPRSTEPLDFTTFGELGEIIKKNWGLFASVFNEIKAVEKVMSSLNTLRNPIAHCSVLAEDEILRLELSMRDWFRLGE
jgi:hypothetical protein